MIYFIQHTEDNYIKIGVSGDTHQRVPQLRREYGRSLKVLGVMDGNRQIEQELHRRFKADRRFGEWFKPSEELLAFIAENARPLESRKRRTPKEGVMPRLGVTVNDPTYNALERHAKQRGAPVSLLVREAIGDWLKKHGQDIDTEVSWGGDRRERDDHSDLDED